MYTKNEPVYQTKKYEMGNLESCVDFILRGEKIIKAFDYTGIALNAYTNIKKN